MKSCLILSCSLCCCRVSLLFIVVFSTSVDFSSKNTLVVEVEIAAAAAAIVLVVVLVEL